MRTVFSDVERWSPGAAGWLSQDLCGVWSWKSCQSSAGWVSGVLSWRSCQDHMSPVSKASLTAESHCGKRDPTSVYV